MTTPQPYLLLSPGRATHQALFGYRLPHLPDMLADHTLLGSTDTEKVAEILSRWTHFILGLRKWPGSAFAIRYHAYPATGRIDIMLLGRMQGAPGRVETAATAVSSHLAAQLTSFGMVHEPLNSAELQHALSPFPGQAHFVEARQHEEVTPFLVLDGEAYVVHPFWAPAGSALLPFETMLRQPAEVTVNLYLEPTSLSVAERDGLLQAAQIAQSLADQSIRAHSEGTLARRRDPQAELVARIYGALHRELTEPFLLTAQCASPDAGAAWSVARAFGAMATRVSSDHNEQALPSSVDLHRPASTSDLSAANSCFTQLTLLPWGSGLASPGKERLVYLAGARGATSLFRFPISVRGGVPGIAVRQGAPDFEPGPRPAAAGADELHLGNFRRGGAMTMKLKHLARHALVTGFTGAGKTNTVLFLLDQLWRKHHTPFLVIEAAKKEYRGLLSLPHFQDLLVFTLGDETCAPFRLNPFELLPGVRLESHLGQLQNCFDAALPQFGILPSIVAESLEMVYRDKGWKPTDRGVAQPDKLFPTMRELYAKVIQVTESRGYAGETYHNIRAAAAGRIGNLLRGSRGRMFACQRSVPMEMLMNQPVVLELNDLNQQDKALTMMFLLMMLREYREQHPSKSLVHVTVVEEAHNVMENVASVGASEVAADTRAKAVEAFAAMLAEVRAYGEGVIISDQSPDKLAPDAVRNTNLQIAHQLRHRVDREAIAAAMLMSEAQQEFLGKLRVGEAAVFLTGYDRATFMQVPNYKDGSGFGEPDDGQVAARMRSVREQFVSAYLPFDGCRFCGSPCTYREAVEPSTLDKEIAERFQAALLHFELRPQREHLPENWRSVAEVCVTAAGRARRQEQVDAAWCYLAHEIDFPFTESMRRRFHQAVVEVQAIKG